MSMRLDAGPMFGITLIAAALRFWNISHPAQVVFDEVHFGKFAAYYLRREYYFDVHPPLAKLLNAFAGWLSGFKGDFDFENISDDYIAAGVPYVGMRALPALMGSAAVPIVYAIMRETGHLPATALLSAALLAFDNAHIAQDRLILLDAALCLFMIASLYSYIRFYKERYNEFATQWWFWMIATGVNLALTLSCKMVGLLTFASVGAAVAYDLWILLDIKRGLSMDHVLKHFWARVLGLIIIPIFVYLFWFWVHFKILTQSGTGDAFMSSQFQQTLDGNSMLSQARELHWGDSITLKHKGTDAFLHSHLERYPLKYDDGRISSQGQQVTGYPYNDTNNVWEIAKPDLDWTSLPDSVAEDQRQIKHLDIVRLRHINSNAFLLTHDVASPLMPTNEEITVWPHNDTSRFNDTLFELHIDGAKDGSTKAWKSKSSWFRLVHVNTRVAVWTHKETALPEWGFGQQEVNGNKNAMDKSAMWFVDDLYPDARANDYAERIKPIPPRPKTRMSFLKKFVELQLQMLQQNNQLTQSHPYASGPLNWPFVLQGISFWTQNDTQEQIYLIGNLVGWWAAIISIAIYSGIMGADALARRRGVEPIDSAMHRRMTHAGGFFFTAWAFHYFPFFLMNRQLFIHHYLPAHIISCLMAGCVFNFVVSETINFPVSRPGPGLSQANFKRKLNNTLSPAAKASAGVIVSLLILCFWFFSPLTYGTPGLTTEEVNQRKLLGWSLHFAK
ncbi:probable pmt4-dolichyl-phosphate-mannose--protein o-mannosyltransferase [Ceraceosorus bombacis]|uniref:Dolichyl-phosphate-mannose--protein mannosyltransferase n=1 Tax=Ceraceosorus bombacis TaxID=401625 RepID=A0A0P1BCU7_9BASI|nr:probable pmt4-dolichyl-phosphate-mannose--protein o-mannosyltransferase [Ceraceosorus bombacis]